MPPPSPDPGDRNRDTQPIAVPTARSRASAARGRTLRYWMGGAVAVLILALAAASFWRMRPAPAPGEQAAAPGGQEVPPALRPYYDRAQAGDVNAMRMLGTMYYNGLNVPQDTKEGIRWYRKAAAAGSVAARRDLQQLGLTLAEP